LQHIIVIGGGYAGLRAVEKLANNKTLSIILIDKNPYHYLQTQTYQFLSGRLNVCDITYDLESFCSAFSNVEFVCDEAMDIKGNSVICKNDSYNFDKLIIATGAIDFIPSAFKQYSYAIKELKSAFRFKERFLQKLFLEVTEKKKATIVICGAGQSGVELAADLASVANECGYSTSLKKCDIKVILIEAQKTILPYSKPYIIFEATKRLKQLGVTIFTSNPIKSIDDNKIWIENIELHYDLFIFTGGIKPSPFIDNLNFPKNNQGYLKVNQHLQVNKNIYAIGDCTYILNSKGKPLSPTAQIAEQSAEYVAKHIQNRTTKPFNGRVYGTFTALGKNYAVGHIMHKIYFRGVFAYYLKNIISAIYSLGIKVKINIGYKNRKNI